MTGVVDPAGMFTVVIDRVALEESLLARVIVMPPTGAGVDKLTGNAIDAPSPTVAFTGRLIVPNTTTFALALALATFGVPALAVRVELPAPTPETSTATSVVFCAIVTLAGIVAAEVLLELRLIVKPPAGAGEDKRSTTFCEPPAPMVISDGTKLRVAPTVTVLLSPVKPGALAAMMVEPKLIPLTWAGVAGLVSPCAMKTFAVMDALDGSLLVSPMVTPPTGAGVARVTCNGTDWPGPTVTFDCTVI